MRMAHDEGRSPPTLPQVPGPCQLRIRLDQDTELLHRLGYQHTEHARHLRSGLIVRDQFY